MSASNHRGPSVLVVGFHHARGPEIELCISDDGLDHIDQDDYALLPFMALSDGAHLDFSDTEILRRFYDSLIENVGGLNRQPRNESLGMSNWKVNSRLHQRHQLTVSSGLSLREMIREFKHNTLVLFKCLLLQPKGSIFGPYTPLQKLDMLADYGTKSYVVGSTNSLLLQQKDRYSDILIDLDQSTVNISSPSLRSALALTPADRRWINFLTQTINDTWDDAHPEQPKTHGYLGSEEFIRLQFEEYLLALLSSMKYHLELTGHQKTLGPTAHAVSDIEGDPALEFGRDFLESWQRTSNFALYDKLTADSIPFSIVEPRHPCAGGMGMEDIQRKIASQVSELHLGERVSEGKEALGKHIATGHKRVVSAFNNLWADRESKRTEQRQKQHDKSLSPSPGKESRRISDGNTLSRASSQASVSTQTPS
ncbi:late secretory pathway protein avl9, partial [Ascosphaera pollenicola]